MECGGGVGGGKASFAAFDLSINAIIGVGVDTSINANSTSPDNSINTSMNSINANAGARCLE